MKLQSDDPIGGIVAAFICLITLVAFVAVIAFLAQYKP